ncbi:MAG: NAD(P)H-hydrate epimerase [Planctomycetes bacterium]|nr:NAD(P)H-hydrate epimerase [Planctomycetota bacterium]
MRSATSDEMRRLDRMASEEYGIPSLLLMENAGRGAAEAILPLVLPGSPVVVLAGKGNNGGDGFVIARHLHNRGLDVRVVLVARARDVEPVSDPGVNLEILRRMRIPFSEWTGGSPAPLDLALAGAGLVVDALLGTGLSGEVRSPYREAILAVNHAGKPVVAVDVPSGLDADTGRVLGVAVRAVKTCTFGLSKRGFGLADGPAHCGEVVVIDISLPRELLVGDS